MSTTHRDTAEIVTGDIDRAPACEAALRSVVEYLCSEACLPRLPGTRGGLAARRFVEDAFADLGLVPAGEEGYLQPIPAIGGANVVGMVPGLPPERSIVFGAHFDACVIDGGVNPGASDNAASVAVMLEVAKAVIAEPRLQRSVVFIGFDGEEPPYFQTPMMGSRHFVANPTIDLDGVDLMICLDMVGHAIGHGQPPEVADTMIVFGAEKTPQVSAALAAVPVVEGMHVRRLDIDIIDQMSDYSGFQDAGIPFLFYNTLRNEHYHRPTDTPDTLDYSKMAALVTHLVALIEQVSKAPPEPFIYDAVARHEAATLHTLRALFPTLPAVSRITARAPKLLDDLAARAAAGLTESEWQLVRRISLAIEDGLQRVGPEEGHGDRHG